MSDNRDKPADNDPDATVSLPPRKKAADDDATVMMPSRDALKAPDEDATVRMPSRAALEKPVDDDATVTNLTREALLTPDASEVAGAKAAKADDDSTVMIPPGGFKAEAAAETAADSPPPPPPNITTEPSRMPIIAGGLVVLLVVLYFMFAGGEKTAPVATKPTSPSTSSSSPAPAASSAPSAPAAAPTPAAPPPVASAPATPSPAPATPAAGGSSGQSKIADLLAADIKRGTVAVAEEGGGFTITMPFAQQFGSGSADPEAKLRSTLLVVASALDKVPGSIVVTGHADATPSNNAKFPSNQELSAARGASAARLMAGKLRDPKRISSDGASDSKSLAPSDTAENRAKNRRVVIVLKPA